MNNCMHLEIEIAAEMNANEIPSALDDVSTGSSGSESDPESWASDTSSSSSSECSTDLSEDEPEEQESVGWQEISGKSDRM